MSDPQLENGYVKIATEIIEALIKYRIPGAEMQCLMFIIRKTYGWNKKEDAISITQFEKATGMKRSHVCRAIAGLSDKNIISTNKGTTIITKYRFNKRYRTWVGSPKKDTSPKIGTVASPNNRKKVVPIKVHTIDTITKDTITKNSSRKSKTFDPQSIPYLLSETLLKQIKNNQPDFKPARNGVREATLQRWSQDIDKMIRLDKRNVCAIWNMVIWCQHDDFWFPNILSGAKLRKQYDQLAAQINREYRKKNNQHDKLLEVGKKWLEKQKTMSDS